MTGCVILDSNIVARKNGKQLPCEALQAENAKLREENQSIGLAAYELGRRSMAGENAKLRELVREMHATISRNNSWWDCTYKDTRRFADRMRELGVEVDDGNRGVEQGERDE